MPYRDPGILAVVFDYDETLVTGDSTTRFPEEHGIDGEKFWGKEVAGLVKDGYENTHAWLNLFLEMVGDNAPLGPVTQTTLREFGATLDDKYAPGIPEVFDDLRTIVATDFRDISIEFYVISGGLEEIIRGSKLMQDNMTDIFGCLLGEDPQTGYVARIKRCITFTDTPPFRDQQGSSVKGHACEPIAGEQGRPGGRTPDTTEEHDLHRRWIDRHPVLLALGQERRSFVWGLRPDAEEFRETRVS